MAMDAAVWDQCHRALEKLIKYSERDKFDDARDAVGAAHLATAYAAVGEDGGFDELMELVDEEVIAAVLGDAAIDFAVRADGRGRTLIDRYLDERGAREPPAGREFLRALKASRVGVFEVLSAEAGGAFELRDALEDGATFQVVCDPDFDAPEPGELIGARLAPFRDRFCFAGGVWSLAPGSLDALRSAWAGEGVEELAGEPDFAELSAEELRESARANLAAVISNLVVQQALAGPEEDGEDGEDDVSANEDGEAYDPQCVSWEAPAPFAAEVVARLDASPVLARWPDGVIDAPTWSWLKPGSGDDEGLLGSLCLSEGKLELFVNSAERAERGRTVVEAALRNLLGAGRAASVRVRDVGSAKAIGAVTSGA